MILVTPCLPREVLQWVLLDLSLPSMCSSVPESSVEVAGGFSLSCGSGFGPSLESC